MKIFAKNELKEVRMKRGFSLRSLAAAAGVSYSSLSHIENCCPLSPTTAQKICTALSANFDDLFELRGAER